MFLYIFKVYQCVGCGYCSCVEANVKTHNAACKGKWMKAVVCEISGCSQKTADMTELLQHYVDGVCVHFR